MLKRRPSGYETPKRRAKASRVIPAATMFFLIPYHFTQHPCGDEPPDAAFSSTVVEDYRDEASLVMYFFTRSSNIFWTISGDGPATSTSEFPFFTLIFQAFVWSGMAQLHSSIGY